VSQTNGQHVAGPVSFVAERRPRVSFGLPVFNGERSIGRALQSVRAQSFGDFELVVSDNASTDATRAVIEEHARSDSRIRLYPQPVNAGIVANFNRAFRLSRGEYFRWIGADDWLEPSYAEKCVAALDAHPEAVGVTTYQGHWSDAGQRYYLEHTGDRVESPLAHERLDVCLWLMQEDFRRFDPMYTMHRRRVLEHTRGLRAILNGDQMLAAELSLLGPYTHVPECLAHRGIPRANRARVLEILRPPGQPPLDPNPEQFVRVLLELVRNAALSPRHKLHCCRAILFYYLGEFETARIRPLRVVLGQKLRELGVPLDRLRPR
jgi:glycosyltransferase involved in cell wall biosynthesis